MVPRAIRPLDEARFFIPEREVFKMLEKKYNHLEVEKGKYENWKSKNYFNCDTKSDKTPFCPICGADMRGETE